MHRALRPPRLFAITALGVALAAALLILLSPAQSQGKTRGRVHAGAITRRHRSSGAVKPTIVLVNGAWANNDAWAGEIYRLQRLGYTVIAPPNPLQSLSGDSETIADLLNTISGPIVLVGHSYGGMVITNAAYGNLNVKALVYVDAFAPAQGESALGLDGEFPGSGLNAGPPSTIFNFVPFPGAASGDSLVYVKPSVFEQVFANGLRAAERAELAATQDPATFSALTAASGPPAWKTIPSWYVLGETDKAITPAAQLFMARRMHAHITDVPGGHLSMIEDPDAVTNVIVQAASTTS
jgi:pimeloyl-ACP methyl ester carboxylesterase